MTDLRVSYDLEGYHFGRGWQVLRKRFFPVLVRFSFLILAMSCLFALFLLVIGGGSNNTNLVSFAYLLLFGSWFGYVVGMRRFQARIVRDMAKLPLRAGPTVLTTDDRGVRIVTNGSEVTVYWHAIIDALPGPDGILLAIGPTEFLPIPASAFVDQSEQAATLEYLRARLSASEVFA